jgi:AcrR family transcriptional regulator
MAPPSASRAATPDPAGTGGGDPPTARAARAAETRSRILDAARRVLAENGATAFTTRRVASLAGVSHGMVHYHFRDKRDLILALLVHARRDWVEPLEEIVDGPGTATDRMRAVIEWVAAPATKGTMRVHLALYSAALDDGTIRTRVAHEYARWRAPFTTLFRELGSEGGIEGLDPEAVGDAFATAADGLVQQQAFDPDLPTDRILTALFERLVPGDQDGVGRVRPRSRSNADTRR